MGYRAVGSSVRAFVRVLFDGLRSALFLKPRPSAFEAGLGLAVAICALGGLVSVGLQYAMWRDTPWYFDPAGITFAIGSLGLLLVLLVALPFARAGAAPGRIFVGLVATSISIVAVSMALAAIVIAYDPALAFTAVMVAAAATFFWMLPAGVRLGHGLAERRRWAAGLGTMAVLLLSGFTLPQAQVIASPEAESPIPSLLEVAASYLRSVPAANDRPRPPRLDAEAILHSQHNMLRKHLAALEAPHDDRPALFFLGMAPYSAQDVFKREVASVKSLFETRFGTAGRSLVLVNHRETVGDLPLASMSNLDEALQHIGGLMRRDRDVLVLFLTTHGSPGTLSVSFPSFPFNDIAPERLRAALDKAGIDNRVLVISACHAGSFIPALQTETSLLVTAARSDRTSFGCSNENEWTYFGDAYFNHALRNGTSFVDAFATAADLIAAWEKRDGLTPSEPQIFVGANIQAKLGAIAAALAGGDGKRAETNMRDVLR